MSYSKSQQSQKATSGGTGRWPWGVALASIIVGSLIAVLLVRPSDEKEVVAGAGATVEGRVVRSQPQPRKQMSRQEETSVSVAEESEPEPVLTEEEKRVTDYELVFDALVVRQEDEGWKPTAEDVASYKRVFDRLSKEQKLDQIPHAQNLLTDASFDCLKAILMDPKEPQEVLESIYHDLLNRPEEMKYAVLREVHKVKDHPLRQEIEELDELLGD